MLIFGGASIKAWANLWWGIKEKRMPIFGGASKKMYGLTRFFNVNHMLTFGEASKKITCKHSMGHQRKCMSKFLFGHRRKSHANFWWGIEENHTQTFDGASKKITRKLLMGHRRKSHANFWWGIEENHMQTFDGASKKITCKLLMGHQLGVHSRQFLGRMTIVEIWLWLNKFSKMNF